MMMRLLLFVAALAGLPLSALANDLEGTWALRIDNANIFTFEISEDADGEWQGVWTRPESFNSNGVVFAQLTGSERLQAMAALEFAETIELSFDDPRPGAVPDIFRFRQLSENQAEMTYVGTDFEPYPLVRVARETPIGPFDGNRIYDRDNAVLEAEYIEPEEPIVEQAPEPAEEPEVESPAEDVRPSRLPDDFLDDLQPGSNPE